MRSPASALVSRMVPSKGATSVAPARSASASLTAMFLIHAAWAAVGLLHRTLVQLGACILRRLQKHVGLGTPSLAWARSKSRCRPVRRPGSAGHRPMAACSGDSAADASTAKPPLRPEPVPARPGLRPAFPLVANWSVCSTLALPLATRSSSCWRVEGDNQPNSCRSRSLATSWSCSVRVCCSLARPGCLGQSARQLVGRSDSGAACRSVSQTWLVAR